MTTSELLQACLSAFNEIPNKALNNNKGGFKSTYDIAVAIEKHLPKIESLHEAIADIAQSAGIRRYYGGDSREDVASFIQWAKDFEKENEGIEWGISDDRDYIISIDQYANAKMDEANTNSKSKH